LYRNTEPGSCKMGVARKPLIQLLYFVPTGPVGSGSWPSAIIRTSFTVSCERNLLTVSGRSFGKKEITLSLKESFFSCTANPTAVAVKLLLQEYKVCLRSDRYGFHHPSAITFPCRSNIKL